MNANILLHIILGLFVRNKSYRSIILIDCEINAGLYKYLHFSNQFVPFTLFLVEISKLGSFLELSLIVFDLSSTKNPYAPVDLIVKKSKQISHIGVALNFDCDLAKDVINLVK